MSKDAISLLTEQHEQARKDLEALASTTDRGVKTRQKLLEKVKSELTQHMLIEEEIFYPAFKDAVERKKDKRLYYEAQEEHKAAKKVLKDVNHADPATEAFGGKVKVLQELVEHHVKEEEEELFPRAKQALSQEELVELGERMHARAQEIEAGRSWDTTSAARSA